MFVRDVSNYLAIFEKVAEFDKEGVLHYYDYHSIKQKGCFEVDKELHKDPGMRIVPIALEKYFVEGIPVEETIKNHKDILDFCLELKINRDWESEYRFINKNGDIEKEKLGRITRFFISGSNGALLKIKKEDGKTTQVNKGFGIKIFNRKYESDDYNINYSFYIKEANKIINAIVDNQLNMFYEKTLLF